MRELPNFIEGMSLQAIFNTAYVRTMRQGYKARGGPNGACVYRAEDGSKCSIGHLMADKVPPDSWVWGSQVDACSIVDKIGGDLQVLNLFQAIQHAHDYAKSDNFCPSFCSNMEWVAAEFDLDFYANLHLEEDY